MDDKPKYIQAREALRQRAEDLSPGAKLPSVNRLHQELGLSQWTINKAIQELIEEGVLDLIPNRGAFVSRTRRTNGDIGVIWPEVFDSTTTAPLSARPYVAAIIDSIRVHAAALGRNLVVTSSTAPLEPSFVSGVGRIAGLLIHFAHDRLLVEAYRARNIPVVFINPLMPMAEVPFVCNDDFGTIFNAVNYLLSLGHRRIVHVTLERHLSLPKMRGARHFENRIVNERIKGYEQAMCAAELEPHILVHRWKGGTWEEQEAAFLKMFNPARPTACCCFNDGVAARIYRACERNGIDIPGDLSVVGHDGHKSGGHEWSPLTTMRMPFERLGQSAVEMLDAMIKGKRMTGDGLVLPSRLVQGASTAPPADAIAEAEEEMNTASFALSS